MATRYHWQDGGEDVDIVSPPPPPSARWPRLALWVTVAAAAALVVAGAIVWKRAQRGERTARSDLQAVVSAEAAALERGDEEVYLSLQDYSQRQWYRDQELYWDAAQRAVVEESGSQAGDLTVTAVELRDDRAWVEVRYGLQGVPYRRVQFYRLTDGHWRRTAPDERFWGARREIETEHLRLVVYKSEEEIVRPVVDALELLFQQMLEDFALDDLASRVTFEFRPAAEAGPAMYSEAHFLVPSPLLLGVRSDDRPDPDLLSSLAQSACLYLAIEKSGLYIREPGPGSSWLMLKGLVAWELEHRLSLPVVPAQWVSWFADAVSGDTLPPLAGLWPPFEFRTDRDSALAFVQAESLVGYAVELRGLGVLPVLLEALGAKLTPEETIQAAVQMELSSFEAGWQAYVRGVASAGVRSSSPDTSGWRYRSPATSVARWQPPEGLPDFDVAKLLRTLSSTREPENGTAVSLRDVVEWPPRCLSLALPECVGNTCPTRRLCLATAIRPQLLNSDYYGSTAN